MVATRLDFVLVCWQACDLDLCRVYIMSDANYPCWAVLVPRIDGLEEVTDLTSEEQALLWKETVAVTKALQVISINAFTASCLL